MHAGECFETQSAHESNKVELKEFAGKLFVGKLFTRRFVVKTFLERRDEFG